MKNPLVLLLIIITKTEKKRGFFVNLNTIIFTRCALFCSKLNMTLYELVKILIYDLSQSVPDVKYSVLVRISRYIILPFQCKR